MKHLPLLLVLIFWCRHSFAQAPKEITPPHLESYKAEAQQQVNKLRQELAQQDYLTDFEKQVTVEFRVDTFQIERLLAKKMEIDYSTAGMVKATYEAEAAYDKLLNKYYLLLLRKLNPADKELLKQAQRHWLQYRDSERKFNTEFAKEQYSGGGTVQSVVVAGNFLDITRRRVLELYNYLSRYSA